MAQSQPSTDQMLDELRESPIAFLEMLTSLDGKPTVLEPYQRRFLADESLSRIVNKSRQLGFSTVIAGEALARAVMLGGYRANFVSINRDEAGDKIAIAKNFYYSMPDFLVEMGVKPKSPWNDADNELAFHSPPRTSSIISQPASAAVRGGRKDIYFDEFAHIRDARKLYQAATPATVRGDSRLTIVSTPLGQSGLFYDIFTDQKSYPSFSRHSVPWFECSAFVRPELLPEAIAYAADKTSPVWNMSSEERVRHYGNDKMLGQFLNFGGDLMSFVTEFEAMFFDEADAYFTLDLIVQAKQTTDEQPIWKDLPPGWKSEGRVTIGVDLARKRDETVFTVVEHLDDGRARVVMCYATQEPYEKQYDKLRDLSQRANASRVTIDETGLGQMFVDWAKGSGDKKPIKNAEGVSFTNQKKEKWATTFKADLQKKRVLLIEHPQLTRQIHGIRRTRTETGLFKFEGLPHDDFFWSLCLALYGQGRRPINMSSL